MRRWIVVIVHLGASGCLLATPPSAHMGGANDAAATSDAGADGAASPDDGGDIDVGNDAGLTPVSALEACGQIATVVCQAYVECCDTAMGTDTSSCVTTIQSACDSLYGPIFRAEEAGYDPLLAAEVLAEGRAYFEHGRCGTEIVAWYHSRMGLQRALRGTIDGGQPCAVSGYDGAAAVSCDDIANGCIANASGGYSCIVRGTAGASCRSDADCMANDYCEGFTPGSSPSLGFPGHCRARLGTTSACNDDVACDTYLCDKTVTPHVCAALTQHNAYCDLH